MQNPFNAFCARYDNPVTANNYRNYLTNLFTTTGRQHPADLSEADIGPPQRTSRRDRARTSWAAGATVRHTMSHPAVTRASASASR